MASEADLVAFIARQKRLLAQERAADVERSSLVLSSCSPRLLELRGLSLNNLGVVNVSIGLGGKRRATFHHLRTGADQLFESLIELERPSAYHTSQIFPPHTFRYGSYVPMGNCNSLKRYTVQVISLELKKIPCPSGQVPRLRRKERWQQLQEALQLWKAWCTG